MLLRALYSPDSRHIAATVAADRRSSVVVLWELATQKVSWVREGPHEFALALAFASDGRWLVVGGWDGSIRAIETETGKEMWRARFEQRVEALAASSDGSRIAVGLSHAPLHVLDAQSGKSVWASDETMKGPKKVLFCDERVVCVDEVDLVAWILGQRPKLCCHHRRFVAAPDEVVLTSDPHYVGVQSTTKSHVVFSRVDWQREQRTVLYRANIEELRRDNPPRIENGVHDFPPTLKAYVECAGQPHVVLQKGDKLRVISPSLDQPEVWIPCATTHDEHVVGDPTRLELALVGNTKVTVFELVAGKVQARLALPFDIARHLAVHVEPRPELERRQQLMQRISSASAGFQKIRERLLAGVVGVEQEHALAKDTLLHRIGPFEVYFIVEGEIVTQHQASRWKVPIEGLCHCAGRNLSDSVTWPKKARTSVRHDDEGRWLAALLSPGPFAEHNDVESGKRMMVVLDSQEALVASSTDAAAVRLLHERVKKAKRPPLTMRPLVMNDDWLGWHEVEW